MPVFEPPPRPRFSCSISRASGKRSRTSSSVPSVEPWSTTIVSWPRTLSSAPLEPRQRVVGDDDDGDVSHGRLGARLHIRARSASRADSARARERRA